MLNEIAQNLIEEMRTIETYIKTIENKINELDKSLVEYRVSMQNHITTDQDMYAELKRMNDILAQNTESLKVHIHRTELLEEMAIKIANRITQLEIKQIEERAIEKWTSDKIMLIGKIMASILAIIGAAASMPDIINWIKTLRK
jgi:exonuclease VII small subunit